MHVEVNVREEDVGEDEEEHGESRMYHKTLSISRSICVGGGLVQEFGCGSGGLHSVWAGVWDWR